MAPNPRRLDDRLRALYERIPRLDCQGLCWDSCGTIACSVRERQRAEDAAGRPLATDATGMCTLLTPGRECAAYNARPMICRLWGVARGMACPYGCKPERVLTRVEAAELLAEADRIGGVERGRADKLRAALRAALASVGEDGAERLLEVHQGHVATLAGRRSAERARPSPLDRE